MTCPSPRDRASAVAEAWKRFRLASYIYSNSGNERFLIEISRKALRVFSSDSARN